MTKLQLTYHFDSEDELRAHLIGRDDEAPAGPAATETVDQSTGEVLTVDSDGFPFNADLHSESRATNADGRWKVKRGKAEAEAAARAAFKAAGGTVAEVAAPATALPVAAAMPTMPSMPAAAEVKAPVALGDLVQRLTGAMQAAKLDGAGLSALYAEAGDVDPNAYAVNETLRGKLWALLDAKGL